jgi:hypothetical protein
MDRAEYEAWVCQRLGDEQLFFSTEEVGHLPADFKRLEGTYEHHSDRRSQERNQG